MNRPRTAYALTGFALALVALASLIFAVSTSPSATDAAAPATEQASPEPVPVPAVRVPADDVVDGAAAVIASRLESGSVSRNSVRPPRVCGAALEAGLRVDSARIAGPDSSITIIVSAWRPGAASSAYRDLARTAGDCFEISSPAGQDELSATGYTADARWGLAALRTGDVLTVATVTSLTTDPSEATGRILQEAHAVLSPRLRDVCADPGSATSDQDPSRDPYGGRYEGLKVKAAISTPDILALSRDQVSAVLAVSSSATWQPPGPRPVPSLAPLSTPPAPEPTAAPEPSPSDSSSDSPSPSASEPASPAPSGTPSPVPQDPPSLVDPSAVVPPAGGRPAESPGPEPTAPKTGPARASLMIPALDTRGPGCGWSFTGTAAPIVTSEAIVDGSRKAAIRGLLDTTAEQGRRMAAALTWPQRRQAWADLARAQANWDAYQAALEQARADFADARERYRDSVEPWQELGVAIPSPAATPRPTRGRSSERHAD